MVEVSLSGLLSIQLLVYIALPLSKIRVRVTGHIQHPGSYYLSPGSRAVDAVQEAGGVTEEGSVDFINLAQKLVDGDIVNVPEK